MNARKILYQMLKSGDLFVAYSNPGYRQPHWKSKLESYSKTFSQKNSSVANWPYQNKNQLFLTTTLGTKYGFGNKKKYWYSIKLYFLETYPFVLHIFYFFANLISIELNHLPQKVKTQLKGLTCIIIIKPASKLI